jgi:hypothetical protein
LDEAGVELPREQRLGKISEKFLNERSHIVRTAIFTDDNLLASIEILSKLYRRTSKS